MAPILGVASSENESDAEGGKPRRSASGKARAEVAGPQRAFHRVYLNDEFAVAPGAKKTWGEELEGGCCEAMCVSFDDDDPTASCNSLTALLCGTILRAERVGNMPVLWAMRRPGKPTQLLCLVGPFWPCLIGVTYPLILGVSLFSALFILPHCPSWVVVLWCMCTVTLVVSLGLTGCTNPGIVRRYRDEPPPSTVIALYSWRS